MDSAVEMMVAVDSEETCSALATCSLQITCVGDSLVVQGLV